MKTAYLFAVISLVFSVSVTANFQNDHRQGFGGFGQGNNNNNNERFGQGNRGSNKSASQSTIPAAGSASSATSTSLVIGSASSIASTSTATEGASTATSTSTADGGASSIASTSTATEGASTATSTSTAAGGASNTKSTSTAAGGASNDNSTSTGAGDTSGSTDPQSTRTLDDSVIATGFENDGQDTPTAGQVASLTSSNNFINFCLTTNFPITNGKQITTGSCNPAPMGIIPSNTNMPSAKFVFPKNGDTSLSENTPFTIQMAVQNFQTGAFVNAQQNYFAAPQNVNNDGQIIGHSHVVVEALSALDQTTPTDPTVFAFFKGLNDAAVNGVLTATVTAGLPAGFYKLSSINTAANHQPVLVPVAQHGSLDDAVYFTVNSNGGAAAAAPVASSSVASAPAQPTQAKHGKRSYSRALN